MHHSHDICIRTKEINAASHVSSSSLSALVSAITTESDPATSAAAIQSCRCIETIVQAIQESCKGEENSERPNGEDSLASLGELLDALRTILGVGRIVQEDFAEHGGAKKLMTPIDAFLDNTNESALHTDAVVEYVGKAARAIVVWCKGFEAGKVLLMADDAHIQLTKCIEKLNKISSKSSQRVKYLCNVCDAMRSLCTGDDVEVAASKTFTHSRLMGEAGAHHCLVSCMREYANDVNSCSGSAVNPIPSICNVLKAIGANDEICQEIANDGAIGLISSFISDIVTKSSFVSSSKAAFGLLRQLAKSDANKASIIGEDKIMEALDRCLSVQLMSDEGDKNNGCGEDCGNNKLDQKQFASVREQAIGMLVSLSLRNPEAATRFCDDGIIAATVDSMKYHSNHSGIQRQGCMMIRNCVVRCPELRPTVLSFGTEDVIRKSRTAWPDQCKDVGTAALRDLGIDNYNED